MSRDLRIALIAIATFLSVVGGAVIYKSRADQTWQIDDFLSSAVIQDDLTDVPADDKTPASQGQLSLPPAEADTPRVTAVAKAVDDQFHAPPKPPGVAPWGTPPPGPSTEQVSADLSPKLPLTLPEPRYDPYLRQVSQEKPSAAKAAKPERAGLPTVLPDADVKPIPPAKPPKLAASPQKAENGPAEPAKAKTSQVQNPRPVTSKTTSSPPKPPGPSKVSSAPAKTSLPPASKPVDQKKDDQGKAAPKPKEAQPRKPTSTPPKLQRNKPVPSTKPKTSPMSKPTRPLPPKPAPVTAEASKPAGPPASLPAKPSPAPTASKTAVPVIPAPVPVVAKPSAASKPTGTSAVASEAPLPSSKPAIGHRSPPKPPTLVERIPQKPGPPALPIAQDDGSAKTRSSELGALTTPLARKSSPRELPPSIDSLPRSTERVISSTTTAGNGASKKRPTLSRPPLAESAPRNLPSSQWTPVPADHQTPAAPTKTVALPSQRAAPAQTQSPAIAAGSTSSRWSDARKVIARAVPVDSARLSRHRPVAASSLANAVTNAGTDATGARSPIAFGHAVRLEAPRRVGNSMAATSAAASYTALPRSQDLYATVPRWEPVTAQSKRFVRIPSSVPPYHSLSEKPHSQPAGDGAGKPVVVNSYNVISYQVLPGDTYDSIARQMCQSADYGPSLQRFNRDRRQSDQPLVPGSTVRIPPVGVLQRIAGIVPTTPPNKVPGATKRTVVASSEQQGRQGTATSSTSANTVVVAGKADSGSPSEPRTAAATPSFLVREQSTLYAIAKQTLGDGNRFREIFELNRDRLTDPTHLVPAGTTLRLPGTAGSP